MKMPLPMMRLRSPSPSEAAPKSGAAVAHHEIVELFGMDEVRVRMMVAEILERRAVPHRARRETQPLLENLLRIGPVTALIASKASVKPPAAIARIAAKSNRVSISAA